MDNPLRNIIEDVHSMMVFRLFGSRPWLADREACAALNRKLQELGLQERCGNGEAIRPTRLGNELQVDLVMAFIGVTYEFDVIVDLENHGLIDEYDADLLFEIIDANDPERVLRPVVQKAYLEHFNPSGLLS